MTVPRLRCAAFAALALVAACGSKQEAGPRAQPPAPVAVGAVVEKPVRQTVSAVGNVAAATTVAIRPQVSGVIQRVLFREGQKVKTGDVLFEIDPRPARAALSAAESALARDRAQAEQARADAKRYADLVAKEYVTAQQFESARTTADALAATVQVDLAAVEKTRLDLAYCTLRSPIDGRTGSLLVQVGNLAQPSSASPLVTIAQTQPVYVAFSVPDAVLPRLKSDAGLKVTAQLAEDPTVREGKLTFIDNAVNSQTATILVKATFPNEDEVLWPGQFVNVALVLGERAKAIVAPAQAVQRGQQGDFVWVVKDDLTVEVRAVVVSSADAREAVVEKGLSAGERVVVDGQLRLTPGAKVVVKARGPSGS